MVGQHGLEPWTFPLSEECSNQLSYWPMFFYQLKLVLLIYFEY
jgi:hypothetical protein